MIVRAAADAFEKPVINIFQNLKFIFHGWWGAALSWWGGIFKSRSLTLWASTMAVVRGIERSLCICRFRPQEITWTVKNNLRKCLTEKANGGFNCVYLGWKERLDTFLVRMPCRPPRAAYTALLSSSLTRFCPLGKGLKFYTSPFSKTLLYTNASKWILIE